MIETEEQRRWWFATHPEYSSSRRGTRGRPEKEKNENAIDPREVDKYVDNALKYETDGPLIALLKSVKRNFGTEAKLEKPYKRLAQVDDQNSNPEKQSSDNAQGNKREATFGEAVLKGIDNTLQDWARWYQNLTGTGGKRWKVGDDLLKPTSKSNDPSYEAQRQRMWKNKAAEEGAVDKWGAENVERMKKGRAPLRKNPRTGEWESKELHHDPVPKRQGGKEVIDLWPDEHADVDPYRRLKKR